MKKLIYILMFLLPVVVFGQQPWYKSLPLDNIWVNVGDPGFTTGGAWCTSLAFSAAGQPYVAFVDSVLYWKTSVMKFDGTDWVNVGNAGFSAGEAYYTSLAFSQSGEPYVAYDASPAMVMKYDGTNWVNVGNSGFLSNEADYVSLAFNPTDGTPYVAFKDWVNSKKASVMKFDGTNWGYVGSGGFSAGEADYTSLAFNSTGQPYVAYEDYGNNKKATVMKFDGSNWVSVGVAGFSAGNAWFTSLAFSPSDVPYVAFNDTQYPPSGKATVMKFDGTNWVNAGNAGFSAAEADWTCLAFNSSGVPYVAYNDNQFHPLGKVTVMRLSGNTWINVGDSGFSGGMGMFTSLAFSPTDGKPYVAYTDASKANKATVMRCDSVYTGINERQASRLSIYPNPAEDKCEMRNAKCDIKKIEIFNLSGERVYYSEFPAGTGKVVEVELNFPAGVYFVRVTGDKMVEVGKLIKN
jgi:hypothetical protein